MHRASAFTLVETIIAVLAAAVMLPTLYAGFASGFSFVQLTRENLRATQVMVQRMEAIRLASWQNLQNPAYFPTNSTEYYNPAGSANGGPGTSYTINYNWAPAPSSVPPSYRSNMCLVTVTASWKSGSAQHSRSMQSYVARYGIQGYVAGK
jgi:type II secretory pathway pseudopilin PulG